MKRILFKDLVVGKNYRMFNEMIDIVFTVLRAGPTPVVVAWSLLERRSPDEDMYDRDHDMVSHENSLTIQLIGWLRDERIRRTSPDPFTIFLSDDAVEDTDGHFIVAAVEADPKGDRELPVLFRLLDVEITPFEPGSP